MLMLQPYIAERDPKHYGTMTLADIEKFATKEGEKVGLKVVCAQSNYEGDMWV